MPRSINDLQANEKLTIALATIHLELSGDTDASKTVAKDFDVSSRGVTVLRTQAIETLRKHFNDDTSAPVTSGIPSQNLKARLGKLIGLDTASPSESTSGTESPSSEEKEEPLKEESNKLLKPLELDEVFDAIVEYNRSGEGKIQPSARILKLISLKDQSDVNKWIEKRTKDTKALEDEFGMTRKTNTGLPKTTHEMRELLGLED